MPRQRQDLVREGASKNGKEPPLCLAQETRTSVRKSTGPMQFLTKADTKLYHTYLLKENLRLTLKADPDEIFGALTKWMAWVQRCRIPVFR